MIFPLDADDLIEPTTLECSYWTLKTNPNAAWAYTNIVNFGKFNYIKDFVDELIQYRFQRRKDDIALDYAV